MTREDFDFRHMRIFAVIENTDTIFKQGKFLGKSLPHASLVPRAPVPASLAWPPRDQGVERRFFLKREHLSVF
jgi:hypothetical protein